MIVVTGAHGFIGSCMVSKLNLGGIEDLVLIDEFENITKENNLVGKEYIEKINRNIGINWIEQNAKEIEFIFHIGARTDTTEFDYEVFEELNIQYSKDIWNICVKHQIPMLYASSAATYGDGELGYEDNHEIPFQLKPLNPYGESKNEFDKWVLKQKYFPPFWAGLKFFNVYGPNEYHKARMASVIFHFYNQLQKNDTVRLFKSHKTGFADGEQIRDFVYVKDVVNVMYFLYINSGTVKSGLYNLGTGKARTFKDLTINVFQALNKKVNIEYIDTPIDIRDKYQYFTEADMTKLTNQGYREPFFTLEEGVHDYVKNYLSKSEYY
jgi:ADP-L-glycero-D-manno-heptose 6-epimerase